MNVKIEEKPAFKMFGVERIISMANGQNFKDVPKFWQESFANGMVEKLEKASGIEVFDDYEGVLPVHAVMSYKETGDETFPYMIGALLLDNSDPSDYEVNEIPAAKWAIFSTEPYQVEQTTEHVQALWNAIFSEWFPSSGYEVAIGARLEMYYKAKGTDEYCEIWIPVQSVSTK